MAWNLFISYDLNDQKRYDEVRKKIESLARPGTTATRVHRSFWHVRSDKDQSKAFDTVEAALDKDDYLCVVTASDAVSKSSRCLPGAWQKVRDNWNK